MAKRVYHKLKPTCRALPTCMGWQSNGIFHHPTMKYFPKKLTKNIKFTAGPAGYTTIPLALEF